MKFEKIIAGGILGLSIAFSVALVSNTLAQADQDIQYPVPQLGNCKNESDCRLFCDDSKNLEACLDFAEQHDLIPEDELEQGKRFLAAGSKGPGGCTSKDSCEAYCNDISRINECVAFAEKNGLMPPEELKEAKQIQAAMAKGLKQPGNCRNKQECDNYCNDPNHIEECIAFGEEAGLIPPDEIEDARKVLEAVKRGARPPPCRGRQACDSYCSQPENMEECITFGEAAGFIPPNEIEDAKKMLQAVKRGVKPPPCRGKKECDNYCSQPENMEGCMTFAIAAGFMPPEEIENAKKMLEALKKGVKPPACKGREECDVYCAEDEHLEECMNFAIAAGFIPPEEVEMMKKTGGKGPGNCRGKEACESFCQNPDNQETCFNFAKEHGLIPEEDMKRMEEGRQQMMQGFNQAPPQVMDCLNSALGSETIEKIKSGTGMPSREIGDKMQQCFETMKNQMGPPQGMGPGGVEGGQGMGMPEGFSGPGGCRTPEECQSYCQSNPEECGQPGGPEGENRMMPEGLPPEEMQRQIQQMIPEGMMPEGIPQEMMNFQQPPSPEQIQQIQQEQMQQIQQEVMQQMQPPMEQLPPPPPPSEPPPPQSMNRPPTLGEFLLGLLLGLIVE